MDQAATPTDMPEGDTAPSRATHLGRLSMAAHAAAEPGEGADIQKAREPLQPKIPTDPRKPSKLHAKKFTLFGAACAGLVVGGLALIAILVAMGVLSPHFTVVGIAYTKSTDEVALAKQITERTGKLQIVVSGDGEREAKTYTFADAGIAYNTGETAKNAIRNEHNTAFVRRLAWWRTYETKPVFIVDAAKRDAFVAANTVRVTKEPVNATLSVDNGVVAITESKDGTQLSVLKAVDSLQAAATDGVSARLVMSQHVLTPAVTTAIAKQAKTQAEKALKQAVVFTIGTDTFTPTPTIIGSWVEPLDPGAKKPSLTFSKDRILAYIDRIAEGYVTPPRNEVAITGSDGVKHVYAAGRNGTDIANKQDIALAIANDLAAAKVVSKTLTIGDKPYETVIPSYSKWILVNLTTKRLVAYEGANPVNEIKVSAGAPETPTVTGVYSIYAKYRSQTMTGYNADGTKYTQPNVEWINYFYRDYALHGNYWRPVSWFGEKNGSHGCVGMLNDDAEWVYNWAPIGTTVIVY